jgi:7,8-dihydropterin-6-yl-methyl-4-(beta-D-ribofuranosyl)aminobenzene 5'-phosphate synthase
VGESLRGANSVSLSFLFCLNFQVGVENGADARLLKGPLMKIAVLCENFPSSPEFESEHGLSFYVETAARRFLFDFGASSLFLRNAERLGVDVSTVDAAFLSHGHRDHGGGLAAFLEENRVAPVYASEKALQSYYSLRPSGEYADIGVGVAPKFDARIVRTPAAATFALDAETILFSDAAPDPDEYRSEGNATLFERFVEPESRDAAAFVYRPDRFLHEQHLIATTENGRKVLLVGCAHRGIVSAMTRATEILGAAPDVAVGGFHLSIPSRGVPIPERTLDAIAERLRAWPTRYFTGHCSGRVAFERARRTLGDQIAYFSAGDSWEI